MNFPNIGGTVYNMMRMAELNTKWMLRKSRPWERAEDPESARLREQAESARKGSIIAAIDSKLKAGGELSPEEMRYLKENDPALYQEALEVQQERAAYEKALKRCKTKEDVQRLNTNRMHQYLLAAKAVSNNPGIPEAAKQAQLDKILRRMMGVQNVHMKFLASKEYAALPSEAEEKKRKEREEKPQRAKRSEDTVDFRELMRQPEDLPLENRSKEDEKKTGSASGEGKAAAKGAAPPENGASPAPEPDIAGKPATTHAAPASPPISDPAVFPRTDPPQSGRLARRA